MSKKILRLLGVRPTKPEYYEDEMIIEIPEDGLTMSVETPNGRGEGKDLVHYYVELQYPKVKKE